MSGVLSIASSDVTVRNCRIHDGPNHGIQLYGDGLTPVLQNLVIENNAGAAVEEWNREPDTMNPTYDGLVANNNGLDAIKLDTGGYFADATLNVPGHAAGGVLTYIVPNTLSVGSDATLTLEQGVVMQFTRANNWGYLTVHGHLLANGVSFMGRHEIPGSWIGMLILQDGSATLQDCQILYAGDTTNHTRFRGTAVHIETSEFVSMHGCTIRDSASMAVDIAGGADVDIRGNNIYNNKYGLNGTALSGAIYSADSSTSPETTEPPEADFIASTRIPVDARFSWWGHPSGPTNTAGNPDGQGTPITGNVIFSPWAKSPVTEFNPGEHQNLYLPAVTR